MYSGKWAKPHQLDDWQVVQLFVDHLKKNGFPQLQIVCRPDEEDRNQEDIDAIAPPFAIEHTSVDSLKNQRGGLLGLLKPWVI
jgi:hypothetical protein